MAGFDFYVWREMFVTHVTIPGERKICKRWPPPQPQMVKPYFFEKLTL